MKLVSENTTRKIDGLGRIGIPKGLRNKFRLDADTEMEIYTFEQDDKTYIAFEVPAEPVNKYQQLVELMQELEIEVPNDIMEKAQQ